MIIGGIVWWVWAAFVGAVLAMLMLDLVVLHRKAHAVGMREAAGWSVFWIALALVFNAGIYFWYPTPAPPELPDAPVRNPALEFLAGYLIEKSLSVDNLFVFLVIFTYFKTPAAYQHRVLFWGVLGAIVMRGVFIGVGAFLLAQFHWLLYVFGVILLLTALKLFFSDDEGVHPERNPLLRLARKFIPVTSDYVGQAMFVRAGGAAALPGGAADGAGNPPVRAPGGWMATPLFLVLIVVESTDLVFAVDSIPAIFAITHDPFIVFTSNIMAILGLRALYFLLAGMMDKFRYLRPGLAVVLAFIGVKMLGAPFFKIGIGTSLGVVAGILALAVAASLLIPVKPKPASEISQDGTKTEPPATP
jgi:tellurite resistance protein TerC